jgi:citrate lyase subunit beta/citryl-CoA lyase
MVFRTFLFTPGNHARRMEKARQAGADAVILDLEDAVAIADKVATRAPVRDYVAADGAASGTRLFVRINGLRTPFAVADLAAVAVPGLTGIVLPKAESADDLAAVDLLLSDGEREHGLAPGAITVIPIIETAKGVQALPEIARAAAAGRRVRALAFGSGDFSNDLGVPWARGNSLLLYARMQMSVVSRAFDLDPPLDTVYPLIDDDAGLLAEAREAREIGYQGKMCIHPRQIPIVNEVFTPSRDEIATAREIADAFDRAEREKTAAIVVNGVFVDYPVAIKARKTLDLAAQLGLLTP